MSQIETFWSWFQEQNERFLCIEGEDGELQKILLDELEEQLHVYCDQLSFEIGFDGEYGELVITAEGNIEYFTHVEKLVNNALDIANWKIIAFLQPSDDLDYVSDFEDVEITPSEAWFLPLDNKNKPESIGLRICLPDFETYKNSKWLEAAVYKLLDHVLGEKAFALDVDYVEIRELPSDSEHKGLMELKDLRRFIEWKKRKFTER